MKKIITICLTLQVITAHLNAQEEPGAGKWVPWFITSVRDYRLPKPTPSYREKDQVIAIQEDIDSTTWQQIQYWNAGATSYRWQNMMYRLWMTDTSSNGPLANMLLSVATYDATLAAWYNKYLYKRDRPFVEDKRIKAFAPKPESPSYPCEYSVAAGVAVTIISHYYPSMADSVNKLAQQMMQSRVAAGVAFPGDTHAGFDLGKRIAENEIAATKNYISAKTWNGKMPQAQGLWKGENPIAPMAGNNKTVVLDSSSQFRPPPPPDYTNDMAELKKFKPTFRSMSNAFYYASQPFWEDLLNKKIFEYNLHLDPPRSARLYAITAVAVYDGFAACWDAKYAYWGTRPDQYDTTYHPVLLETPPFPGYPSGHATISGMLAELYGYFFPAEKAYFRRKAKEAAESRFQGGIHFRTDNEVGLELGKKVAAAIINKVKTDGSENEEKVATRFYK